jgi:hypothetical protein
VDILIFMDILEGFAPATVAAPGAISLKMKKKTNL